MGRVRAQIDRQTNKRDRERGGGATRCERGPQMVAKEVERDDEKRREKNTQKYG